MSLVLVSLVDCASEPPLVPISPAASAVQVETSDPPPGSQLLGQLQASDGTGCGIGGDKGSLENATRALRMAAVRQGANFVKITETQKPYSGHDCYHLEFKLTGLAYRVGAVLPREPLTIPCRPACASGYVCRASVCEPHCEPACGVAEICRADRVCAPEKAP